MRVRSLALLSVLALVLAGAGSADARSVAARATSVDVTAKDFSFTLSRETVP
jgi:hypothetical protein